ncbi:MAG: efflux RND transporter periplasmic adaptor subunit [Gammaproteobacteria bacterium]|nr:efflux RND transporter periplasmic adaptor subunit [Gammaproteobacteria bacterium]
MNSMHKILIMPALLGTLLLAGCSGDQPEEVEAVRPVKAYQVSDADQFLTRSFPGRATAHKEVDLAFRVGGELMLLPNDLIGQQFKQGELIASLDPRDYEVKVEDMEGQLQNAQAAARRAQSNYKREQNIYKEDPGATSKTSVENKLAERDAANADVRSITASLEAARDELGYTYLKAPFDGTVTAKYTDNFQNVRAKENIVRLLDNSKIEMVLNIPENVISRLPNVKDIAVTFDAFPDQPVPAEIFEIGTEASQTTRTYPVTLIMDQPEDFTVLAGMAGRARGLVKEGTETAAGGVHVPVGAVFTPETEDSNYVWVVDEQTGVVRLQAVVTGELVRAGIQVLEGLKPGDWVAIAGLHTLREGQQVSIMTDAGE